MRFLILPALVWIASSASLLASNVEGQVIVKAARDNSNAVVYVDKIPGKVFAPPANAVRLDQLNLTFVPHVLPILAGTTVEFPNSDEVRHNVFSPSPVRFNLGTYEKNTKKYYRFEKPGVATLLCNVHAEMSAYVVVTETPYFAVTGKDGKFILKDVPPGNYTVKVWHEKAKSTAVPVEVSGTTVNVPAIELKR